MAVVIKYAQLRGWMHYHTHDSRRSAEGFPDLVLVRGDQLIFAELKSEKGKTTPAQDTWLMALENVATTSHQQAGAILEEWGGVGSEPCSHAPVLHVFIWRPSDWTSIEQVLK